MRVFVLFMPKEAARCPTKYVISTPNSLEDAAKLADLFNSFDSIWPGGFTHGVPDTAVSVQERHRRMRRLAVCIVEHESGEFAGYCNLKSEMGITDRAYLPLLGASPKHLNQGVGKMLLLEMIRRVTANGFRQVTLGTWGGNLKAVPLYKKTGFHWVPETNVHMRNFIPGCLTVPEGRAFFADRDWYACLQREIVVAPDEVDWHGRNVFPYHFQDGDAYLKLTFDSVSEALTALETPEYSVACWLEAEECAAGETFPLTWEIQNRTGKPLEVVILTETDAGLELKVQERLIVAETATFTRPLRVLPDARPARDGENRPRVRSTVLINGQPISLETGVKVVRPVEIEFDGRRLLTGLPQRIAVKLRNRLDRELTGTLALDPHPSLACEAPVQPFTLPAKAWDAVRVHADGDGSGDRAHAAATVGGRDAPASPGRVSGLPHRRAAGILRTRRDGESRSGDPESACRDLDARRLVRRLLRHGGRGAGHAPDGGIGAAFRLLAGASADLDNRIERTELRAEPDTVRLFPGISRPGGRAHRLALCRRSGADRLSRDQYLRSAAAGPTPSDDLRQSARCDRDPDAAGDPARTRNGRGDFPNGERDALPPGLPLGGRVDRVRRRRHGGRSPLGRQPEAGHAVDRSPELQPRSGRTAAALRCRRSRALSGGWERGLEDGAGLVAATAPLGGRSRRP